MLFCRSPFRCNPGLTLAVLAAAGTLASPGTAAQSDDRRVKRIEEVIVTARRVEESLQDTPISVSAFSSVDLEQMGASEAKDIAKFTPNLQIRSQSSSFNNYNLSIRGDGEISLAIDPTVGVYLKEYRDFGIDFGILGFAMNNYAPLSQWGLDLVYRYNR